MFFIAVIAFVAVRAAALESTTGEVTPSALTLKSTAARLQVPQRYTRAITNQMDFCTSDIRAHTEDARLPGARALFDAGLFDLAREASMFSGVIAADVP